MAEETSWMKDRRFCTYENGKRVNHKKTVHVLLQQCMDQGLTVGGCHVCPEHGYKLP